MTTLLVIAWVALVIGLVFLAAVRPQRTKHSWFELKRKGDEAAMRRERLLSDILALRRFFAALIIVALTGVGIILWQAGGVAAAVGVLLIAILPSRVSFIQKSAQSLYVSQEARLLRFVEGAPALGWLLGSDRKKVSDQKLESPEHLLHLVESSGHVLTPEQQSIIIHGVQWHTTTVETIMTKRDDIVSIKHNELLGPLVLDDLHRSGHNRFPVSRGSLDNVIGTIDITELLEVDAGKKSLTAEKSMSPQALRIELDEPLPAALALLQKSHQHLLIVIDQEGKTVGLLTLADITGSLLGS